MLGEPDEQNRNRDDSVKDAQFLFDSFETCDVLADGIRGSADGNCKGGRLDSFLFVQVLKFQQVVWSPTRIAGLKLKGQVPFHRKYRHVRVSGKWHFVRPPSNRDFIANMVANVGGRTDANRYLRSFEKVGNPFEEVSLHPLGLAVVVVIATFVLQESSPKNGG